MVSVAVLGATGVVGQKALGLLAHNTKFSITELVASDRHIGKIFADVCDWREPLSPLPENIASLRMIDFHNLSSDFIVSCLPSEVAREVEPMLAAQGKMVFSNASTFRMHPDVPLLVPEINQDHFSLLARQKTSGKIITNPNCSAVGVSLALAPLINLGEIEHVSVVTMQSISGAGYPGVSALDITANTIPHITGSEAIKITEETKRILGHADKMVDFGLTVHVHRVPVLYGHTATLHVAFKNTVDITRATDEYEIWNQKHRGLFVLHTKEGRPQSIKDLNHDDMRVHIGHLQQGDRNNVIGLVVLTHNLVRGAAGAVIANMETYLESKKDGERGEM